jgi:hypothetical protein
VVLTFSYHGELLKNFLLIVEGLGYADSGKSELTNSWGELASTIYFSAADMPYYDANPNYKITLGGSVLEKPGPLPLSFLTCQ